ncbi:hypothetical protein J4711_13740 [Staphylococcus epidermidis]|nr:hypothetical protein [Staphylococcus epidermidis]
MKSLERKSKEELANRFPMGSASSIIDEMVVNQVVSVILKKNHKLWR